MGISWYMGLMGYLSGIFFHRIQYLWGFPDIWGQWDIWVGYFFIGYSIYGDFLIYGANGIFECDNFSIFHGKSYLRTSTHGPFMGYPLVNVYIAMEHHHAINGYRVNQLFLWPFSIAMLVISRGYQLSTISMVIFIPNDMFHDIYHQIPLSQIPIYFMGISRSNLRGRLRRPCPAEEFSFGEDEEVSWRNEMAGWRDGDSHQCHGFNGFFSISIYVIYCYIYIVYNNIYDNNIYIYIYT